MLKTEGISLFALYISTLFDFFSSMNMYYFCIFPKASTSYKRMRDEDEDGICRQLCGDASLVRVQREGSTWRGRWGGKDSGSGLRAPSI